MLNGRRRPLTPARSPALLRRLRRNAGGTGHTPLLDDSFEGRVKVRTELLRGAADEREGEDGSIMYGGGRRRRANAE